MSHPGVLKSLDAAKTQVYHFTAILIAGMGFFTDAYDLFVYATPLRCASGTHDLSLGSALAELARCRLSFLMGFSLAQGQL